MNDLVHRLMAMPGTLNENGKPEPVAMPLSSDALDAWIVYYNRHRDEQAYLDDDLSAAWSKLEAYAARFALIIHCVRLVGGETEGTEIDQDSVRAGSRCRTGLRTRLAEFMGRCRRARNSDKLARQLTGLSHVVGAPPFGICPAVLANTETKSQLRES